MKKTLIILLAATLFSCNQEEYYNKAMAKMECPVTIASRYQLDAATMNVTLIDAKGETYTVGGKIGARFFKTKNIRDTIKHCK